MTLATLIEGGALSALAAMSDASVDAVITSPPYGAPAEGVADCLSTWMDTDPSFMTSVPSPALWSEIMRVSKPGAHLLVFAGTLDMDLVSMSIRLAGYEMRDALGYIHECGLDTDILPGWEPIILARKPLIGTVAENVLKHGTGAMNIDACRIVSAVEDAPEPVIDAVDDFFGGPAKVVKPKEDESGDTNKGRWPANIIHDNSEMVLAAFAAYGDRGGGYGASGGSPDGNGIYGKSFPRGDKRAFGFGDKGTAARFFYAADGVTAEDRRLAVVRWLVRLVTPPNGLILDPFAASAMVGNAASTEGFRSVSLAS